MMGWYQPARIVCTAIAAVIASIIRRDADDRPMEDLGAQPREISDDSMVTVTGE
jgi:hypothetical protein